MLARILFCAPSSGTGKTTVTCAVLRAMQRRGLKLAACKSGPDYIDPMFHQKVLETPSTNLDLFFFPPRRPGRCSGRWARGRTSLSSRAPWAFTTALP